LIFRTQGFSGSSRPPSLAFLSLLIIPARA
jgi:hypothetical protein